MNANKKVFWSVVIGFLAGTMGFAQGPCINPPSGIVAWWPGDGNPRDIVGFDDGTLIGGVTYQPGEVAQAFSLNGGYVSTPPKTWGFSTTCTVMAWIKTTTVSPFSNKTIFSIGHDNANDEVLLALGGDGRVIIFNHNGPGDDVFRSSDSIVTSGLWVHVVGVLAGGDFVNNLSRLRIYVNGARETGALGVFGNPTDIADTTPRQAIIGWRTNQDPSELFQGEIDEVAVFNRALSDQEIQDIYQAGTSGMCKIDPSCATLQAQLNSISADLTSIANDLGVPIPGATTADQITNLMNAILGMNNGAKNQLRKGL